MKKKREMNYSHETKLKESFDRAAQTCEVAQKMIDGQGYSENVIVVHDDPVYRDEAEKMLRETGRQNVHTFHAQEDLEKALKGNVNVVFLMSFSRNQLETLRKFGVKKLVAVSPSMDSEEYGEFHEALVDMRAVILKTPLSPEMLNIAL